MLTYSKSAQSRAAAARRRTAAARGRLRVVAQRKSGWKILEFFVQNSAAWGALWYFLVSTIGVTYSWGFYQRLDIPIFDFFETPDFLLSAFQNMTMLIIGILVTFIGLGIFVYGTYNSSIYSAYDLSGITPESRVRVRRESVISLSITLVSIVLLFLFVLSPFQLSWSVDSIKTELYPVSVSILILVFLASFIYRFRFIKSASNPVNEDELKGRVRREAAILSFIALLFIFTLFFFWQQFPQVFPKGLLYLIVIGIFYALVFLAYQFIRLAFNPVRYAAQGLWYERILLFTILVEVTFIIPFLWGEVDSHAALEDTPHSVKVTLSQNEPQPETPQPDRTLLLGTTSSFHIFYECENALKNGNAPKCGEGHPFIIPTANIASLEFKRKHVGLPVVVAAVKGLDRIINGLKSEEVKVTNAITQINTIITSINMSSGVHAKFITQQIESPKPEVATNLGPDKIITVAIALKSYLEGNIPVTHLNETITTLNATIKTLNRADVLDPDLANIAGAIKSLNRLEVETPDLKGIPDAIRSLDPLEVNTPDLKEIPKAIKEHTTEISDAIRELNLSCPGDPKPVRSPVPTHCPQGWEKVTTIWPFPKEEHELKPNSDGQKQLNDLFADMEQKFAESTLGQLILVGRSDAKPVCKQTLALYGSGNGLAQGRAKWIWDELVKKFTTPEQQKALQDRTLLLSAGPLHVRGEASEMNRAKDRTVEVYACWTPKPKSEQAEAPPAPAATTPETPPQEPAAN